MRVLVVLLACLALQLDALSTGFKWFTVNPISINLGYADWNRLNHLCVITDYYESGADLKFDATPPVTTNQTDILSFKSFGFTLPRNATIRGIEALVNRSLKNTPSLTVGKIADKTIQLSYNGVLVGDNKASTVNWTTTITTEKYGGPTDLWGAAWTPVMLNNASLDFDIVAKLVANPSQTSNQRPRVQCVYLNIYYAVYVPRVIIRCTPQNITCRQTTICLLVVVPTPGQPTPTGSISLTLSGIGILTACTLSGLSGNATCIFNYTATVIGTGSHLIKAAYGGDINYLIANGTTMVYVHKRPLYVTANYTTMVYGGTEPVLGYTHEVLLCNDTISGSPTSVHGNNVGSYPITIGNLTAGLNYEIIFTGANLTIIPRLITVVANTRAKLSYDPDPSLTYYYDNDALVFGDVFSGYLKRVPGESVGFYSIMRGNLTLGPNYNIMFTNGTLEINVGILIIMFYPNNKTYGDPTPQFMWVQLFPNVTINITGSLTRQPGENVGEYHILRGNFSAGPNFGIDFVDNRFIIYPRPITTAALYQTKVYGESNPAVLTWNITSGNLAFSDVFAGLLDRDSGENIGTYPITVGTLSVGSNYDMQFVGANFTITPKPLQIIADYKFIVYGNSSPVLTYTIIGLVDDDPITGNLSRVNGSDAGSYAITIGTLDAGPNYEIYFTGANLTISPRLLQVVADYKTMIYGDPEPALTWTAGSLLNNDNLTGSLVSIHGNDVGSYPITIGTLSDGSNYQIVYTGANFTITPRLIIVTGDKLGKATIEPDPPLSFDYMGSLMFGDTFSGVLKRVPGNLNGVYPIVIGNLTLGPNYILDYRNGSLTINLYTVTVRFTNATKTYGNPDPVIYWTQVYPTNITVNITGTLTRELGEDVAFYQIRYGNLTAGPEYSVTYIDAHFTITPRPITVAAIYQTKIYGDDDPALDWNITVGNLAFSDVLNGTLVRTPGENIGQYTITVGNLTAGSNYLLTYLASNLTITPREITIVADPGDKTYGDTDSDLTYTVYNLVSGDVATGTLSRDPGEIADESYLINLGDLSFGPNYNIVFEESFLNISRREVTLNMPVCTPSPALATQNVVCSVEITTSVPDGGPWIPPSGTLIYVCADVCYFTSALNCTLVAVFPVPLGGYTSFCNVTLLPPVYGNFILSADFSGDTNYLSGASPLLVQEIRCPVNTTRYHPTHKCVKCGAFANACCEVWT